MTYWRNGKRPSQALQAWNPVMPKSEAGDELPQVSEDFIESLRLDDEPQAPEADIEQRPNVVIKNGGPLLLNGLMLPLPPSANVYWRSMPSVKKGTTFPLRLMSYRDLIRLIRAITFPSDEAKKYKERISELAQVKGFRFGTEKPVEIDLLVCPRRRGTDCSNYHKVLLDVFQDVGVYLNDNQVKSVRTREGPVIKEGRIVVTMREIQHTPDEWLREAWR